MNVMNVLRSYHAVLAVLCLLSYLTGEAGLIHAWLGYGVAVVILFRIIWGLVFPRQVGFSRFFPSFSDSPASHFLTHPSISKVFILGIALSVILVTLTGVMLDQGHSIEIAESGLVAPAYADEAEEYEETEGDEIVEELHEFFGNAMMLMVGMHVSYLLLFRLPMARFMLFLSRGK